MALAWNPGTPYDSYMLWQDDENSVYMPMPKTPPRINYSNNESISLSEAGTEIGEVTRLEKKTFSITWQLNSDWKDLIEAKCKKATSIFEFGDYRPMKVRARINSCTLYPNSEYTARTNGLWIISVTFTEV